AQSEWAKAAIKKIADKTAPRLIRRRAPAAVPGLVQIAAVALGRAAMLQAAGRVAGEPALFGGLRPQRQTFCGFFIQLLRHRRRAALAADAAHHQRARHRALPQAHGVADLDFSGWLGLL